MVKPHIVQIPFPLSQSEINKCFEMDITCMELPWSKKGWQELNQFPVKYRLYFLTLEDQLVGLSLYLCGAFEAHLLKIMVSSEQQRKGYARQLLRANIENFKKDSLEEIYLEVAVNNSAGLKLYAELGFELLCVKKAFYSDGTAANAMQLKLN